jgi:hypothetical protein
MPKQRSRLAASHRAELDELQKQIDEFKKQDAEESKTEAVKELAKQPVRRVCGQRANYVSRVSRKTKTGRSAPGAAAYMASGSFVQTGQIALSKTHVVTCGLSTCNFVLFRLRTGVVGWHCSSENMMTGAHMHVVNRMLSKLSASGLCDAFLVPGTDRRTEDPTSPDYMHFKADSRQMRERPHTDPGASWRWLKGVLQAHAVFDRIKIVQPPASYKEFVVFGREEHSEPLMVSDTPLFDCFCTYDAEKIEEVF